MKNMTPDKSGNFTPTQVGVLLEELRDDNRIIAEGQADFKKDLKITREAVGKTLERVTRLEITVDVLKDDVAGLKATTGRILNDTTEIKKKIANHDNRLVKLESA